MKYLTPCSSFLYFFSWGPLTHVNGFDVSIETTHQIVLDTTDGTYVLGFISSDMAGIHVLKEITH
jgi:hypothetical protein